MARQGSPFDVLEIPEGATLEQVKAAYRRLAALYHPDRNPGFLAEATERTVRLNAAYAEAVRDIERGGSAPRPQTTRDHPADIELQLRRLGTFSEGFIGDPQVITEALQELLPATVVLNCCTSYREARSSAGSPASHAAERAALIRHVPVSGLSWPVGIGTAGGVACMPRTRVVCASSTALYWTASQIVDDDDVVVHERVTAHEISLENVLGARVKKRGQLDIWLFENVTLTFFVPREHADVVARFVEAWT